MGKIAVSESRLLKDESGATMIEYAFMLLLIALVCIGAVQAIGTNLGPIFSFIANAI